MKILLIAYACEPYKGSEPGVGWHWAQTLAKDTNSRIYVLTRANNKQIIERYYADNSCPDNLCFCYYDLPKAFLWAKKNGLPVNLYYIKWLSGATKYAQQLHKNINFDIAHHLTFGVFRNPAPLYKLGIPYYIGPVGGGEKTPSELMQTYTFQQRMHDYLRLCANYIALRRRNTIRSFDAAKRIFAKTNDTKQVLKTWQEKVDVCLEIGINNTTSIIHQRDENLILYVGHFYYLKGIRLLLNVFRRYSLLFPMAKLVMIGKGDMEQEVRDMAKTNNLNIEIVSWLPQEQLKDYYSKAKYMVFPSMHDSSGNVVLEALSWQLPVITLDSGGPATVLGENLSQLTVQTRGRTVEEVEKAMLNLMCRLSADEIFYGNVQKLAYQRSQELTWDKTVNKVYSIIRLQ